MSAVTAGTACRWSRAGRGRSAASRRRRSCSTRVLIFFGDLLPDPALRDDRDLAEGPRGSPARQHLRAAAGDHLRALGEGVGLCLHRPLLRGPEGRLLEFGLHHRPERDRLDRGRIGERLRAGELAVQGIGDLLHDPAGRLLHPLPGDALSARAPHLEARHLQHDLRRDHGPHDLRHADPDAAFPQLFRLAAARALQGGARRRRRLLGRLLPDHDADVAADLHRRHHPAGHRHLERLSCSASSSPAAATIR